MDPRDDGTAMFRDGAGDDEEGDAVRGTAAGRLTVSECVRIPLQAPCGLRGGFLPASDSEEDDPRSTRATGR